MKNTISEIINELLFIAISQPESIEVNVSYRSKLDYVSINALPTTFNLAESDDDGYRAALLISKHIPLYTPGALKELTDARNELLRLTSGSVEVAA